MKNTLQQSVNYYKETYGVKAIVEAKSKRGMYMPFSQEYKRFDELVEALSQDKIQKD